MSRKTAHSRQLDKERKTRWNTKHRAQANAERIRWQQENPEKVDEIQARSRKKRKEQRNQESRQWRAENQEEARETVRRWEQEHPEEIKANRRKNHASRRAREREAFVEVIDAQVVYRREQGICGICHLLVDPNDFHVDHVIPLAKGGLHCYDNVQIAHPSCNIRKGATYEPPVEETQHESLV